MVEFYREFARRFAVLYPELSQVGADWGTRDPLATSTLDRLFGDDRRACLLPEHGDSSALEVRQKTLPGAVRYVVVSRKNVPASDSSDSANRLREWLWPTTDLPATDLVYDCTEELLHGKAKPILCDLSRLPLRVFALLPTQLERLSVRAQQQVAVGSRCQWEVVGTDASDRRIAGQMPIVVSLVDPHGKSIRDQFFLTTPTGDLRGSLPAASLATTGDWTLVVRSQLNGLETRVPIHVSPTAPQPARANLTADQSDQRWAPQPMK